MKPIIILVLTVIMSNALANSSHHTIIKDSGTPAFKALDFPANILNYPVSISETWRAKFADLNNNRMFLQTFEYALGKGCHIARATLSMQIKNLAGAYNNDKIGFVESGKILFAQSLWKKHEKKHTVKTLKFDLGKLPKTGSILKTLNDGDFSLYIQDDTSVNWVKLEWIQSGALCR